jgi:hypothetical protein
MPPRHLIALEVEDATEADLTALQTGLNYADCSTIQTDGKCYKPNDLLPCLLSAARSYPTSARTLTLARGGREG